MNSPLRFDFTASPWVFDLLTHLWQSTVVALVVLLLIALGRRLAARTRRALGWIAVAKFALPAAWLAKLVERLGGAPKPWLASDALMLPVNLAPDAPVAVTAAAGIPVGPLLAAIWGAGTVGLLACWITRAMRARRRILAATTPAPKVLAQRVAGAAACAGLGRAPRCAMVAAEHGPGLIGVAAPVLMLPRGLAETLTPSELDSILIHECLHLRWRDNWWNAVRAAFVGLLWFNPIAWLLSRTIGVETEKSCDERVLEITGDADVYANSIVASVRHSLGLARPGFSGATTPPVLGRIKAILAFPARRERPLARWVVLLASIGLVAFSGRAGSIAAEASAGVDQPGPAKPRYKVGTVTIKFVGTPNVSESVVRDAMEIRAGREFDEAILDRDIRSIYRTGWFKSIEVKHQPVDSATFNFVVEVTPKPAVETVNTPAPVTDQPAPATVVPPPSEVVTVSTEPSPPNIDEEQLTERRKKNLADANARLEALRPEAVSVSVKPTKWKISDEELNGAKEKLEGAKLRLKILRADREAMLAAQSASEAEARSQGSSVAAPTPALWDGKPVYDIGLLDRGPVPRFQSRPQYPFEMRRSGIGGEVVVDFIVDEKGDVVNAYAVRSSRPEFESAAVKAVSRWKYRPGRKGDQDVHTHMLVPIVFTLNEE